MENNFNIEEFKKKMAQAETDILIDFLGKDFLIFDNKGNVVGEINIESEIDEIICQMPEEELFAYWSII